MSASKILVFVSVVVFLLAAFGVHPEVLRDVDLVALGLFFFASSFLV